MSEIKIDFGMNLPPAGKQGSRERYPFSRLVPNSSFFVPLANDRKIRKSMYSTVHTASKRLGLKFIMRSVVEQVDGKDTPGVRIFHPEQTAGGQAGEEAAPKPTRRKASAEPEA